MHARRTRLGPSSTPSVRGGPDTKAAKAGVQARNTDKLFKPTHCKGGSPGTKRERSRRRRRLGKGTKTQDTTYPNPKH